MKSRVVPPQVVAETIASIITKLAAEISEPLAAEELMGVRANAVRQLCMVLDRTEAVAVVDLIADERVQCSRCQVCVPYFRVHRGLCARCNMQTEATKGAEQ